MVWPWHGRSLVDDELHGDACGELEAARTVHESYNGEGEKGRWLTAVAGERTASSGKSWSERGGEGDLQ